VPAVYSIDITSKANAEVIKLKDGQMIGHLTGDWD
jgi:hypothetical protein